MFFSSYIVLVTIGRRKISPSAEEVTRLVDEFRSYSQAESMQRYRAMPAVHRSIELWFTAGFIVWTLRRATWTTGGVSNTRAACGPRGPFVRLTVRFGNFQIINICVTKCLDKKMSRNKWTKAEWYPVPLTSQPKHYRPNFHTPANFWKILGVCQRRFHVLCRPHTTGIHVKSFGSVAWVRW